MANIIYRQMPAPRELHQQIPAPRAKARMQKPQSGGNFLVQIAGGAREGRGWLWMELIPALENSNEQENLIVSSAISKHPVLK